MIFWVEGEEMDDAMELLEEIHKKAEVKTLEWFGEEIKQYPKSYRISVIAVMKLIVELIKLDAELSEYLEEWQGG